MALDSPRVRRYLKNFELSDLFIEELGWDRYSTPLTITVDGQLSTLTPVAHKHGMVAFTCPPAADGRIPDHATRGKIEHAAGKSVHEHVIIFHDAARTTQLWQWPKRVDGKLTARREHTYHRDQPGDSLIQKLQAIAVSFEEEERLTLTDVTARARQAFDVDRVTRRFYDRFKTEHATFLSFIQGIQAQADREWYASLMLNRLMFVYFIQKKAFLAGDPHYLRHRLRLMQARKGKDQFHSFYRHFLLRLFHEGLGQQARPSELDELLGQVPYLNGGLFDVHALEREHPNIEIPDQAFERLFDFFDAYQWHLDERPLRADNEINPDVLGYIFEKYVNQKQMGAYYTKEDITEHIAKNTVIPFLLDAAQKQCAIAFRPDGAVWALLREDSDRYIYEPVRKGVDVSMPPDIAAGVSDVSRRDGWNRPAAPDYALPTESWREHVARRTRCLELRARLAAGEVHAVNDLITYNLDIRQVAQDVIEQCEGPELLRAFYHALEEITVLDPTCGSGAFLFAALNILEPLYDACLERMQAFVDDLDRSGERHRPEKFSDFRKMLARVEQHPDRRYFILKSIVINNLYGVDIMEEAAEICKLRLFLKLVAQLERYQDIEPLPDIDFNIRAGNTLVGFTSYEAVQEALRFGARGQARLPLPEDVETARRIDESAEIAARAYHQFRAMQIEHQMDGKAFGESKAELRRRLNALAGELDRYLAAQYSVHAAKPLDFDRWRQSHQPFHWFAEFYSVTRRGGFDLIIGNPPYVEYSKVRGQYRGRNFATEPCGNLYALCMERSYSILRRRGRFGFIVQAPIVSTQRMASVRAELASKSDFLLFSTYDDRPSKLFSGMHHSRVAIVLSRRGTAIEHPDVGTTRYHKWYEEERPCLFPRIRHLLLPIPSKEGVVPKLDSELEARILEKVMDMPHHVGNLVVPYPSDHRIYYKITGVGHWFTFTTNPPKFWRDGIEGKSTRENSVSFRTALERDTAFCCLWSTLHFWLYQAMTNCRDFNPSDLAFLPLPACFAAGIPEFSDISHRITTGLEETSTVAAANYTIGGPVSYQRFRPRCLKLLFDEIDRVLAKHYGFTDEELDFIINYDIKYRMGQDADEDGA